MDNTYNIQIKVSAEVYEKYKSRINNNFSVITTGPTARVKPVSSRIFEIAIDSISDDSLIKILKDVGVAKKTGRG